MLLAIILDLQKEKNISLFIYVENNIPSSSCDDFIEIIVVTSIKALSPLLR
jgi:hypothetical protein